MEKLLAILAKGQFDYADDQGDEEITLYFTIPNEEGGIEKFSVDVELDSLQALELKRADGSPVDFSEIYEAYDRDAEGNEIESGGDETEVDDETEKDA